MQLNVYSGYFQPKTGSNPLPHFGSLLNRLLFRKELLDEDGRVTGRKCDDHNIRQALGDVSQRTLDNLHPEDRRDYASEASNQPLSDQDWNRRQAINHTPIAQAIDGIANTARSIDQGIRGIAANREARQYYEWDRQLQEQLKIAGASLDVDAAIALLDSGKIDHSDLLDHITRANRKAGRIPPENNSLPRHRPPTIAEKRAAAFKQENPVSDVSERWQREDRRNDLMKGVRDRTDRFERVSQPEPLSRQEQLAQQAEAEADHAQRLLRSNPTLAEVRAKFNRVNGGKRL